MKINLNLHRINKLFLCILFIPLNLIALAPINLFRPSDKFLIPPKLPCSTFQLDLGYEGSVRVRAAQADDDDDNRTFNDRLVDVMQIYQCKQDAIAMLKGFDPATPLGQLSQRFINDDDNGSHGLYIPHGKFKVPVNLMFSARWHYICGLSFCLHLPYYQMELSDVNFVQDNNLTTYEDVLGRNIINAAQEFGGLSLRGWKRSGIGDLLMQGIWMQDFPQMKPFLSNVRPQFRLGLSAPTGVKRDEDKLLAFEFGNDGSWGIQIGGGLDLTFGNYVRGGLDAEFLYLFGNTRPRRFKTDLAQTDLLFLTKRPAFKEFGLWQQYNLYLETCNFLPCVSAKVYYQHLQKNEDKLYVCSDKFDATVINSAESLQDASANSFIFSLDYNNRNSWCNPFVSVWYKVGFIGKRFLLADTLGITFSLSY